MAGGVFLFGSFILDKQNKGTCCRATPDKKLLQLALTSIRNYGLYWHKAPYFVSGPIDIPLTIGLPILRSG